MKTHFDYKIISRRCGKSLLLAKMITYDLLEDTLIKSNIPEEDRKEIIKQMMEEVYGKEDRIKLVEETNKLIDKLNDRTEVNKNLLELFDKWVKEDE